MPIDRPAGIAIADGLARWPALLATPLLIVGLLTSPASGQYRFGEIVAMGESYCPAGFLPANGQRVSRAAYSQLYNAIGCLWGTNCTTDFPVPDLRGRALVGADADTTAYHAGTTGGRATARLQLAEMASHTHNLLGSSEPPSEASPAGHAMPTYTNERAEIYAATSASPAELNAQALGPRGQGGEIPLIQPGLAVNYCIAATSRVASQ